MQTVKKYANGRLYDTDNKKYLTKEQLAKLISKNKRVKIVLSKTGKDITKKTVAELQANLDFLSADERQDYEFSGAETLPLEQAMRLMDELQNIDALQEQLANVGRQGTLEDVDAEALEQILGTEGRQELEKLRELEQRLEEAGYLRRKGDRLELTPKGIRKIGARVIQDNERPWSGDHNMNPPDVPGMFFCNRPIEKEVPHIEDIAPTALDLFGIPIPKHMDGESVIPPNGKAQEGGS